MNIGDKIPDITFDTTNHNKKKLSDYRGKWLVLYFYPKDSTPGCTLEGHQFRDAYQSFKELNAEILGVSKDSLESHERFKCKHHFPFELITDPEGLLCQQFDVINIKKFFGKEIKGIQRSTFLIDPEGFLREAWRKVKVLGHGASVLSRLKQLQHA